MKVVVIGLGSMGRRRIRLIKQYDESFIIIGIDLNDQRREISEKEFGIETDSDLEKALKANEFDCAFICTSPLSHSKLINICLENYLHVFTELNLISDGYDENTDLANKRGKTLFLSSTFLYRTEIKEINRIIKEQVKKINYTYHVGQYLPDWHPWESFKDFFVGEKKTNGCREIFAIELPWIIEVFGEVREIIVRKSKISTLNIDYDDSYMLIIEHVSGHRGMIAVNVVSRKPVRNLEIFGEDLYLSWDGSAEGLKLYDVENNKEINVNLYDKVDQLENYSKFVVENAYYDEIISFFEIIENNMVPIYDFEKDKIVLKLIDRIEAELC
jgi:predicted dehydrogenase